MAALRSLCLRTLLVGAIVGLEALPAFAGAPRQLFNKTIHISWSAGVAKTGPDGRRKNLAVAVNHTIYVSSAGRLFQRSSRASRGGMQASDITPGATRNGGGEATGLRFDGNRLVGSLAFEEGGRQFVATFDQSFSSCTVTVMFGRERAGLKRKGIDGVMYTIDSMTASGQSCSIREGNAFGT